MGLIDKLQASTFVSVCPGTRHNLLPEVLTPAELEFYRLEQRYARRKHRTTFSTGAQYVDGEYVYGNGTKSPTSIVSKHSTGGNWRPTGWGGSQESRWRS